MDHALAPAGLVELEGLARSRVLLALDFDGTLAPIVDDPQEAAMRPSTRRLLRQVARAYPCVVISGRARADVLRRVAGLGVLDVIGNHGAEPGEGAGAPVPEVRRWLPRLRESLGPLAGVVVEDKGLSLAIHYRRSQAKAAARARIAAAAAGLERARLLGGKQVLNVLPTGAAHKGAALALAMARLGCEAAIYVGDDVTDEDVFALGRPRVLGIRVRKRAGSAAACYIRSQAEIDVLLRRLLDLRPEPPARPEEETAARLS